MSCKVYHFISAADLKYRWRIEDTTSGSRQRMGPLFQYNYFWNYNSFNRCENFERFCFSWNLNAFTSRLPFWKKKCARVSRDFIEMRNRDLSREERVFGTWKFVSSRRVGGHPSLLAPISAPRHGRLLVNDLGCWSKLRLFVCWLCRRKDVARLYRNKTRPGLTECQWLLPTIPRTRLFVRY